jgi:hypothetical protein
LVVARKEDEPKLREKARQKVWAGALFKYLPGDECGCFKDSRQHSPTPKSSPLLDERGLAPSLALAAANQVACDHDQPLSETGASREKEKEKETTITRPDM